MNARRQVGRLAIGACLCLSACGGGDATPDAGDLPFADTTSTTSFGTTTTLLIDEKPDVSLNDSEESYVRFEASWICELQRRTFPTPDAMWEALDLRLTDTGLNRPDYEAFRTSVNNSQDLRDSILYIYQETCKP